MFDFSALKDAATRRPRKPMEPTPGPNLTVEIETDSAPPKGGMDLAAELAECAAKYGMAPEEVIAEFKEFLASKKAAAPGSEAEMPEEETPEEEAMPA